MASLYDLLLGQAQGTAEAQSQNPFMQAAQGVRGWQYQPTTSSEALWMPAVQGLLGGALSGYGKRDAANTAYQQYKGMNLLQGLNPTLPGGVQGPLTLEETNLHNYGLDAAPEGWTPDIGKTDLAMALIGQEVKKKEEEKKIESRLELQKLLAGKGMGLTEDGQIAPIPGYAEAAAQLVKSEEQAKADVAAGKPKEVPTSLVLELSESKGLADSAKKLASELKQSKMSWAELRLAKNFSYFDKDGKAAGIEDLADRLLRSRTGAAAPVAEKKDLKKIASGDWTVGPQRVAYLLEKFAVREEDYAKSVLALGETTKNIDDAKAIFENSETPPTPPAGYELTGSKDANGNYGIRKIR